MLGSARHDATVSPSEYARHVRLSVIAKLAGKMMTPSQFLSADLGATQRGLSELGNELLRIEAAPVCRYVNALVAAWAAGRSVLLFGNGGSAATASHHATDLMKTATGHTARPLACTSLTDNAALLTAIANDLAYDDIFSELVEMCGAPGDLAVAFTTSGTSRNVIKGLQAAQAKEMHTVAFTGAFTGAIAPHARTIVACGSVNAGSVEALHGALTHVAVKLLRQNIDASGNGI
jgi:D-sedoheptulose 7-phosphate isomerase